MSSRSSLVLLEESLRRGSARPFRYLYVSVSCVRSLLSSKVSQPGGVLARFRALSCALSMSSISYLSHGDQTVEAYSRTAWPGYCFIYLTHLFT